MTGRPLTRRTLIRRGLGAAALAAGAGSVHRARRGRRTKADWRLGFEDLRREVRIGRLEVDGRLPRWLEGTLVRNGPARYEVGDRTFNHWFDGLGMLHAFTIGRGRVGYANRFLRSSAYRAAKEEGIIRYSEFATDPCPAIFNGAQATFSLAKVGNANVHVGRIAQHFVGLTEVGLPVRFDPRTLRTLGVLGPEAPLGRMETVHPHRLPGDRRVFYDTPLIPPARYEVKAARGTHTPRLLASIPRPEPAYMHSFGLTERYVILTESPFVVDPLKIITDWEPFIRNFRWKPSRGTTFFVVDRRSGRRHAARDRSALHLPPRERLRAQRQDQPRPVRLRRPGRDRRAVPRAAPGPRAPRPAGRAAALRARPRPRARADAPRSRRSRSSCRASTTDAPTRAPTATPTGSACATTARAGTWTSS